MLERTTNLIATAIYMKRVLSYNALTTYTYKKLQFNLISLHFQTNQTKFSSGFTLWSSAHVHQPQPLNYLKTLLHNSITSSKY